MPVVNFRRSVPRADGSDAPAEGFFRFAPTKPRIIAGTPDTVITPKPFTVDLVGGALTVTLAALPAGSAWSVLESVDGVKDLRYFVVVPDGPGPVDDADLPRVDPSTLSPQAVPEAAWWGVANATITDAAVIGDDLILTRHDGTQVAAGRVTPSPEYLTETIDGAVGSAVEAAVEPAVAAAVTPAVEAAVGPAVTTAVGPAVTTAVGPAVTTAVTAAVGPAAEAAVQAAARPSNLSLDLDGVPFISPGANDVSVYADTDGRPYFVA